MKVSARPKASWGRVAGAGGVAAAVDGAARPSSAGRPAPGEAPGGSSGSDAGGGQMSASPAPAYTETNAFSGESPSVGAPPGGDSEAAGPPGSDSGQGPRRIMTPVDAAIEIPARPGPRPRRARPADCRCGLAPPVDRRRAERSLARDAQALAAEPRERLRAVYARACAPRAPVCSPCRDARPKASSSAPSRCSARRAAAAPGEWMNANLGATAGRAAGLGLRGAGPRAAAAAGVRSRDLRQAGRGDRLCRSPAWPRRASLALPHRAALCGATAAKGAYPSSCGTDPRPWPGRGSPRCWAGASATRRLPPGSSPARQIEIAMVPPTAETCIRHGVGVINTMVMWATTPPRSRNQSGSPPAGRARDT